MCPCPWVGLPIPVAIDMAEDGLIGLAGLLVIAPGLFGGADNRDWISFKGTLHT